MAFEAPFPFGPFIVSATGRLSLSSPDATPGFTIRWRDRPVHVCLAMPSSESGVGILRLDAGLGRIPSTGGGENPERREIRARLFSTLRNLPVTMPSAWHVVLRPDHSIGLKTDSEITMPATAVELVTETTLFLIALTPYLDVLDEAGFAGYDTHQRNAA